MNEQVTSQCHLSQCPPRHLLYQRNGESSQSMIAQRSPSKDIPEYLVVGPEVAPE